MIKSFRTDATCDIWNGEDTKRARKQVDSRIWKVCHRKLTVLNGADRLETLRSAGNQLEKLDSFRPGHVGIRINDKYRLTFRFEEGNAYEVDIVDYHD